MIPIEPINSRARYDAVMAEINRLMDLNPNLASSDGELLALLADLAERYECEAFPLWDTEDKET